jgi:hypothetical protein
MDKTKEFIEKAKKIHGDKYDYSNVEYKNNITKVCINCPEHGEFWQSPKYHLRGGGCYQCGIDKLKQKRPYVPKPNKRLKNDDFIKRAQKIHGNTYDYSKTNCINATEKVCIICSEHGEFWQTPMSHLKGHGCPYCSGNAKLTTKSFIEKAQKTHGNKYDYSKTEYINSKTKVCIICPEHGEFWQVPHAHLDGQGCPICKGEKISLKKRKSNDKFIEEAQKVHGNKYDYSKVKYKNTNAPICIICPEHGEFWQTPTKHIHGHGCPVCNESHLERDIRLFLNENKISYIPQKTFEWLKNDGLLKLDFYLPDYNIAIECQGEHHFMPVDFANRGKEWSKNRYEYIKTLDNLKYKLCKENKIKLLYYTSKSIKATANDNSLISDKECIFKYLKKVV